MKYLDRDVKKVLLAPNEETTGFKTWGGDGRKSWTIEPKEPTSRLYYLATKTKSFF